MGKFNFEDYRQPWETGPHWELKKEFIENYEDMFEEDRLLCLAQAYANVVLMNCSYPDPVMRQISELSKPLQLRKKFQGISSNTETVKPENEQQRVSEKIKSIYEQSGRRSFKQMKFCVSKDQCNSSSDSANIQQETERTSKQIEFCASKEELNSTFSPDFTNMPQTSSEQIEIPRPLVVSNEKDKLLLHSSLMSSDNTIHSTELSFLIKNEAYPEKEEEERIISVLGLPFIQDFAKRIKVFQTRNLSAIECIYGAISKLKLNDTAYFKIDVNPNSSKYLPIYVSKFIIKDCEIASGQAPNKKKAKGLAAEAALNTLYKLSMSRIHSSTDKSQVDSVVTNENNNSKGTELKTDGRSIKETSGLSDSCVETYTNKPPFVLNRKMYNLSLRDEFVLIERESSGKQLLKNSKSILNNSASFNKKSFEYQFEDTPPSFKTTLLIGGQIVATGIGETKEDSKTIVCDKALSDLKKKYYTLKIKDEYMEGFIVTRQQVFDGESYVNNVISESNVGCKMLKNMGWTGGGLGEKGIAEPIEATAKSSLGAGLGFGQSVPGQDMHLFRKRIHAMLQEFKKSENYCDLVFSKDFTKEERKEIHSIAGRLFLKTQSRGYGADRFLSVTHRYETSRILKFLANNGGSNSKFELIDDSGNSLQV